MSRDLLVCCDGTWNDAAAAEPSERSNVWRFYCLASGVDGETKRYFSGVGAKEGVKERLKSAIWGFGIGRAICEAYGWLAQRYQPGDRLFLVGFSRGAFTVRSLAGMIGVRGIPIGLNALSAAQRNAAVAREYEAYRRREAVGNPEPGVQFVGVFDTVGTLGVPDHFRIANLFDRPKNWAFHNTQLGERVRHGRHAIAIDEQRAEFMPTLWVNERDQPVYDWTRDGRSVKQLWFCGQHSDVGGGAHHPATNTALRWMLEEANACGLRVDEKAVSALPHDVAAPLSPPERLWPVLMPRGVPLLMPCNAGRRIHESVPARRARDEGYWPTRWLRKGDAQTLVISAKKGKQWQSTGVWVANGRRFVATSGQSFGANAVRGYIANGGNPNADGTWPTHEEFALQKPVTVKQGGGYLYFRVLRPPDLQGARAKRAMWHTLTISLVAQ